MYFVNVFLKRFFDVVLSVFTLIVLCPLLIIAAVAIKCDSKGPILFLQERRTKNGRVFKMYKLRTMVVNAENMGTGLFNYKHDPRVTRVGYWLRKCSIDELPQLWNVIKGDISLVGPRPCVKYELGDFDTLNKKYKKRFMVKGGITGLAQVKGRNENSWDEKVTYDNQYVDEFRKQGVWLDLKILMATVVRVLKRQDIYEVKQDDTLDNVVASKLAEEEIVRVAHLPDEG